MGDKNEQIKQAMREFVVKLPEPDLSGLPWGLQVVVNSVMGDKTPGEMLLQMVGEIPDEYVPLIEEFAYKVLNILHPPVPDVQKD